jgi:glycosyltransferase involved in cell wall biosynthesis
VRILQVAPLVSPIDETGELIGGAQVLLADLARGLARRGHEITLAAANGSRLAGVRSLPLGIDSASLRPASLAATEGARSDDAAQARAFASVRTWIDRHVTEIDVIHAHAYDAPAFDVLRDAPRPVVHTLHLPPLDAAVVRAAGAAREATMVTVSEANARAWRGKGVPVAHVVHNGIDVAAIARGETRGAHAICAGRVSPEKGTHVAVAVARRSGRPLLIAGGVYDAAYFTSAIEPHVRQRLDWRVGDAIDGIVYIGPRRRGELLSIVGSSAVALMPVMWDEPFGLVAVESLATGTPVVAYRRGGLAEIVDETCGALVPAGDEAALERALATAPALAGEACRRRAERFSLDAMIAGYEGVYRAMGVGV